MPNLLASHPLAALFPELPSDELNQLVRDIKERGQLEPIILYQGLILDGRNRYKACLIAKVKPRTEEFDQEVTKRTPEEFVLSRNLRRRHLSIGQKAALAVDWSEQLEKSRGPQKNKERGRPKGALSEASLLIGINEQRAFEVRRIKEIDAALYQEVREGRRSLNSALAQTSPRSGERTRKSEDSEMTSADLIWEGEPLRSTGSKADQVRELQGAGKSAEKKSAPSVKSPPSRAALEKALIRIKAVMGSWFFGEVKANNLIQKPEEIVHYAKLSDAEMREVGLLLKKGWTFNVALDDVNGKLTPDDEIRALHARTIASRGKWFLDSIGDFGHIVVWGAEKEKILEKLKEFLARFSTPQRS